MKLLNPSTLLRLRQATEITEERALRRQSVRQVQGFHRSERQTFSKNSVSFVTSCFNKKQLVFGDKGIYHLHHFQADAYIARIFSLAQEVSAHRLDHGLLDMRRRIVVRGFDAILSLDH